MVDIVKNKHQGGDMLPLSKKGSDNFQTPPQAVLPLLPYLQKGWTIWECAAGRGLMAETLKEKGFTVVATDTEQDFFLHEPEYDCIVTNPPYSKKNEFLNRAYELGKPFAFLMPLTALETKKRQRLYRHYGLELILLDGRVDFITPSGKGSGSWFAVAWFTNGLNIGKALTFAEYNKHAAIV